LPWRRC